MLEILRRYCVAKPQDDTYCLLKLSGIAPSGFSTVFPTPDNFTNTVIIREADVIHLRLDKIKLSPKDMKDDV